MQDWVNPIGLIPISFPMDPIGLIPRWKENLGQVGASWSSLDKQENLHREGGKGSVGESNHQGDLKLGPTPMVLLRK